MTYTTLIARSLDSLVYLSIAASIISGVWLLEYVPLSAVWTPVLLLFFAQLVFPFLMLPVQIIMGVLAKRLALAQILAFAWLSALLALTAMLIFSITRNADAPQIPLLVFSVAAAVAPWAAFCLKDRANLMFIALVWIFTLAATIAVIAYSVFAFGTLTYGLVVWANVMAGLGLQAIFEARLNRPRA